MIRWSGGGKFIFEDFIDPAEVVIEESGQSKKVSLADGREEGLFVTLHSWSLIKRVRTKRNPPQHSYFDRLVGKTIRITIEEVSPHGRKRRP